MLLHTPRYLLFLLIAVIVQRSLPNKRIRSTWLLVCSYIFYAFFDLRFAAILLFLSLANYVLGQQIGLKANSRWLVWLGVALNLGILAVFKYANFFPG